MYIIAIGWLYIIVLMAATEHSVVAGLLTLIFYGIAPVALLFWIFGARGRRRARMQDAHRPPAAASPRSGPSAHVVVGDLLGDVDRGDAKHDQ
ncbi:MAG TPA: hypothetical protein VN028_00830 [Rhodocyclaceae bacterium]|nr:hypothetical protein [Rhodocyclaceae bacterium]